MALVGLIGDHGQALEYDLMTRTGRGLEGWDMTELLAFAKGLPPDSKLYQETHEGDEMPLWYSEARTSLLLADIYDAISDLTYVTVSANSPKNRHPRRPKRYPRPNEKKKDRIGHGTHTVAGFEKWWMENG